MSTRDGTGAPMSERGELAKLDANDINALRRLVWAHLKRKYRKPPFAPKPGQTQEDFDAFVADANTTIAFYEGLHKRLRAIEGSEP